MTNRIKGKFSILVPCDIGFRDPIAALIANICDQLISQGETSVFKHQVVSAFNEAFNNLAEHSQTEIMYKQVLVVVGVSESQLTLELHDDGRTFQLDTEGHQPPDYLSESGMGLFIMRSFMDKLDYKVGGNGRANVLRMVRLLSRSRLSKDPDRAGDPSRCLT
ncbi:MAG: ATP-binding protein [Myxococcota bacterium]|nr:ATP-binding protein [Myxococcota bacterium]